MSIFSPNKLAMIVFLVLFLSLHGSSARCFGLISNSQPTRRFHLLSKESTTEEKLINNHFRASSPSSSSTTTLEEIKSIGDEVGDKKYEANINEEERARKERVDDDHHHLLHHEIKSMNKNGDEKEVSLKVREKKKGEPQEEFNLDYLPARTHPPVHN